MTAMNRMLKIKLYLLFAIFPTAFALIGWLIAWYNQLEKMYVPFLLIGILLGLFMNLICYSRKVFTIALFYTPLPLALSHPIRWIADVFTSATVSLVVGFVGLGIGFWLNKELVLPFQFYKIKKRILAVVYFFFSIACAGFFLGIPVFNIFLGLLAGNYLSIRVMSNYGRINYVAKSLRQGSLFTAFTILVITTISSIGAISDSQNTIKLIGMVSGIMLSEQQFLILIVAGGILLTITQYFITLFTAKTMLQLWMWNKQQLTS